MFTAYLSMFGVFTIGFTYSSFREGAKKAADAC